MAEPLTRATCRDAVRRRIGVVPAVDSNTIASIEGDPTTAQPHPTNAHLNQLISDVISDLSIKCRIGEISQPVRIPVPAQTAYGPYTVDLHAGVLGEDVAFQLNSIRRVYWNTSTSYAYGQNIVLKPTSAEDMDRRGFGAVNTAPGTPSQWWTQGYSIRIFPAPNVSGDLYIEGDMGIYSPVSDSEVIRGIPADYHKVVADGVAAFFCMSQTNDQVLMDTGKFYLQLYMEGVEAVKSWVATFNKAKQHKLTFLGDPRRRAFRR
jgi:hypothetical protein